MAGKLKNYVSETDKFLKNFDKDHHDLTTKQQQEITKHQRIHNLRDNKVEKEIDEII